MIVPSIRQRPALLLIVAMTLWVAVEMIAGVATRDIPLTELVWLRYVFHLLLMFAILAPRTGTGFVRTRRPILHLARSLLMVVMPVSYILGSRYVPGGPFMGIFWIAPVLVLVFARMIGERQSLVTWGAVLAGWVAALGLHRPSIAAMGWPALPSFCSSR